MVAATAAAAASSPTSFRAEFGEHARLGAATSIHVSVTIDPRRPPVTEIRLLTPSGVDLNSSGLGLIACRRPASEIAAVMTAASGDPCPADSLMGTGKAQANLLVSPVMDGWATLRLHAGAPVHDRPGLVVIADTYNPARFHLTYQGYLYVPPPHFGIGVAIAIPQIPQLPFGAPIALSHFRLVVGGASITYNSPDRGRYHPAGVQLPQRCPSGGLRFRLILRFADGARQALDRKASCS